MHNTLYYGDNLTVLRKYISDESIDLIYLDPPFNSNRNYNVLFKDERGKESEAQIMAFEDTWHWNESSEYAYREIVTQIGGKIGMMIEYMLQFIGPNQIMAYLVMMTVRLVELHRVLKPTGSLYLHCDPTASHYLKLILDAIFLPYQGEFQNEIVWCYSIGGKGKTSFGRKHDIILFYTKCNNSEHTFNKQGASIPRKPNSHMKLRIDSDGREYQEKIDRKTGKVYQYYIDQGKIAEDYWTDIETLNREDKERLGYPTQKPLTLLERIIGTSSNHGDVILDPFCGCGTAIAAAQKLDRHWIGIDITALAISLQRYRLEQMYPGVQIAIKGLPKSVDDARTLAKSEPNGRYQFQWWALSLIKARPLGGREKKGRDRGIDGVLTFPDDATSKLKRALVQVKSGGVKSGDIRDLRGTIEREGAELGVFITLESPSSEMILEATRAGLYHSAGWQKDYHKIQILTIKELLAGAEIKMPPTYGTFKKAQRVEAEDSEQGHLW